MKPTIKVGFPIPLTGPYGVEALDQLRCAKLAIEEFNANGGWDGRFAELLVRDTLFDYELAGRATEELILNEKVDVVVGSLKAEDQIIMSHVCHQHEKIFNAISASDAILYQENRHPYSFHEGMNFHMLGGAIGRYVFSRLGNRVAMLSLDGDYGRHSERALIHVGQQVGVDFVKLLYHKQKEENLKGYLEEIAAAKPQVIILNNLGSDQVNAVRQCRELNLQEDMWIVTPNFSIAQMLEAEPELYEGVVGCAAYYWKLEELYESSKKFNDMNRKKYDGQVAGTYGAFGYNGVRSVLEAIRLGESLESSVIQQAMLALHFDFCKGPQFYRRLDHQSVQCMAIIERKPLAEMTSSQDLFDILEVVHYLQERSFHASREVS